MLPEKSRICQDGPHYLPQLQPHITCLDYDQPAWQCSGTEELLSAYVALRPLQATVGVWAYGLLVMN